MRKLVRRLVRLVFFAAFLGGAALAVRALIGWASGEPGVASGSPNGSYDSWPAVPPAPQRSGPKT